MFNCKQHANVSIECERTLLEDDFCEWLFGNTPATDINTVLSALLTREVTTAKSHTNITLLLCGTFNVIVILLNMTSLFGRITCYA